MDEDSALIGVRARKIRRRRGMSLDAAAGLAGISKSCLSRLESGSRSFVRRGLIEDLAGALGCSVIDLTGQPYLPVDRATADAMATVPGIREAVHDTTLDDPADVPVRPVAELARWVHQADAARDQARYAMAGRALGTLLTELHTAAAAGGNGDDRRAALAALVQACHVAGAVVEATGHQDLALACAARELEAACRLADPTLAGLARYGYAQTWARVGARRRAAAVVGESLAELDGADPTAADTGPAEMLGMGHLFSAKLAARTGHGADAAVHLDAAAELAERTGERNTAWQHFGPTNVTLWRVAVGADLGEGAAVYERALRDTPDLGVLGSANRSGCYHFDLARVLASGEGDRDAEAIRHLDTADRLAPQLIRSDPIARELISDLDRRVKRKVWELESLKRRFGIA